MSQNDKLGSVALHITIAFNVRIDKNRSILCCLVYSLSAYQCQSVSAVLIKSAEELEDNQAA